MDEIGISTVPNKNPKILNPKGKTTFCKISNAGRGGTVTAACCRSATGIYVPPALIFPRKRMHHLLFKDAPRGDSVLLIADNHSSHCSLQAILYLRQNHSFYISGPLNNAYAAEAEKSFVQHPGEVIKLTGVSGIFRRSAYSVTAKIKLSETAFKVTGIEPFDPDIIPELFPPSLVTDQLLVEATIDEQLDNASAEEGDNITKPVQTGEQSIKPEEIDLTGASNQELQQKESLDLDKPKVSIHSISPLPKLGINRKKKEEKIARMEEWIEKKRMKESDNKTKKKASSVKTKLNFDTEQPQPPTSSNQESEETVECPGCGQSFNDSWIQCDPDPDSGDEEELLDFDGSDIADPDYEPSDKSDEFQNFDESFDGGFKHSLVF
ncbi:hypothetical protein J6590_085326 [Homalodisca vitripennis]|nr:hypothetical protein J6590_095774 [Homalodisca vitripennis]KAG8300073.1 hypothetical protein J6590_085326 [Homalodisca vitripennis]